MTRISQISVSFLSVGTGSMVVFETSHGGVLVYDCRLTDATAYDALGFLRERLGAGRPIDVFVASHPDPEHVSGLDELHFHFPLREIWHYGGPQDRAYLGKVGQRLPLVALQPGKTYRAPGQRFLCLNAHRPGAANPDEGSIALHASYMTGSVLLSGDTPAATWREVIAPTFGTRLRSRVLLASHHGSDRFFYEDAAEAYLGHMELIRPKLVVVSVGAEGGSLPDPTALNLYRHYATGFSGLRMARTDEVGHVIYTVLPDGQEVLEAVYQGQRARLVEADAWR